MARTNMNSKFIVLEGLEGAGKTSAIQCVAGTLHNHGIYDIVFTREPGGTPLAEALRILIKNSVNHEKVSYRTELLMLYAARAQLVETVIKPAMIRGAWIIGDRHALSSMAYQGGGRGLDNNLINLLHKLILGDFQPDLTIYLDLPPEKGLARASSHGKLDRIEIEPLLFFERIRARYQELAGIDDRIVTINANQSLEQVSNAIRLCLEQWLIDQ